MNPSEIKKIAKKIKQYDTIVIARHIGPDPDAICSQLSLRDAIRLTYPTKKVFAVGVGVSKFKKFGILDRINNNSLKNVLLIALDVPNFYRVDGIDELNYKEVIKIDHHPFEESFGGIEWIDDKSSSTCQLIAKFILNSNLKINDTIANNLFMGIVSDSDRFLLAYTTVETFKVVTTLLERSKIDFISQYEKLYERPLNEIKFRGYLEENLAVTKNGLGHIKITTELIKKYEVDTATASNMVNDFNFIKEVIAWIFITFDEKNGVFKINIRSRGPVINEIAAKYNGGGHRFASGVKTSNREDVDLLIKDLDEACERFQAQK